MASGWPSQVRSSMFINASQAKVLTKYCFNVAHILISIHELLKRIQGLMVKLHDSFMKKKLFSEIFKALSSILQKHHNWVYNVPDQLIVKVGKGLYLRLHYWYDLSQFISS